MDSATKRTAAGAPLPATAHRIADPSKPALSSITGRIAADKPRSLAALRALAAVVIDDRPSLIWGLLVHKRVRP